MTFAFTVSYKKQENHRTASTSASLTMLKALTVSIKQTVEKEGKGIPEMGIPDHLTCLLRNLGSTHELGRSPGEGKGYPLQYSGEFQRLYSPWGGKELDTTEQISLSLSGI